MIAAPFRPFRQLAGSLFILLGLGWGYFLPL